MSTFLGIGAALAFAFAGYAFFGMRSDIQLGLAATEFFAGLILVGLAVVVGQIDKLLSYAHERFLRETGNKTGQR